MKNNTPLNERYKKPRLITGWILVFSSVVLVASFVSYLLNWKESQSQMGEFLNQEVKSSNLWGKLGIGWAIFSFLKVWV